MKRLLKMLGLTISGALFATAMFATASPAAEFHSEASHTIISGSQVGEDVFTANAGTVKCKKVTYTGTLSSATTTELGVVRASSECTAFGFVSATEHFRHCIIIHTPTAIPPVTDYKDDGGVCEIETTAPNCWIKVQAQSLAGVSFTNEGSGKTRDIKVGYEQTGIKYTQTSKTFPGCTSGTFTNGTYKGAATYKGTNTTGEQVGIWVA